MRISNRKQLNLSLIVFIILRNKVEASSIIFHNHMKKNKNHRSPNSNEKRNKWNKGNILMIEGNWFLVISFSLMIFYFILNHHFIPSLVLLLLFFQTFLHFSTNQRKKKATHQFLPQLHVSFCEYPWIHLPALHNSPS